MKKQYSKPGIIIEDFTIAQNIASCNVPHYDEWGGPNTGSKNSCGWIVDKDLNIVAWLSEATKCNDIYGENDDYNGLCYNNYSNGSEIFGSY